MSCSQARRQLLEQFALGEELTSRSGPHLAHLESCADCRREMGIDRELVDNLRRALRARVDGRGPSEASWEQVRSRTVDRPARAWRVSAVQWRGMVSAAAAAGIMLFAVTTAPQTTSLPMTQSPSFASAARRVVPPVEDARGWPVEPSSTYVAPRIYPPLPGWPMQTHTSDEVATLLGDLPIPEGMR
jgi:anti-sigma factor RsiW